MFTASDDGTVQLWKPLEVRQLSQLLCIQTIFLIQCLIQIDLVSIVIQRICLPFVQVENLNTFQGHSGGVCGLVCKDGVPEFLTISEDCSLRCWTWKTGTPCVATLMTLSFHRFHVHCHSHCVGSFQKVLVRTGVLFQLCASLHWVMCFSLVMNLGCWRSGSTTL